MFSVPLTANGNGRKNNGRSEMTAVVCFRASQPDYIDVDVYVEGHDGGEWNFSIFKDLETGAICFGD